MNLFRTSTRFYSAKTNLKNNPVEQYGTVLRIKLNGDFAIVEYKKLDSTTYDLVDTRIPKMYRGQGLGTILAERIFDHLIGREINIRVSCEFLEQFVNANRNKYGRYMS